MYPQKLMHAIPAADRGGKESPNPGSTPAFRQLTELPPVPAPSLFPAPSAEFLVLLTLAVDAILVVTALFFAASSDHSIRLRDALPDILAGPHSSYILIGSLLYLLTFGYTGAYHWKDFFSSSRTLQTVFKTTCYWLVIFLALCLAVGLQPPISRYFFVWAGLNTWVFLSAWRLGFCHFLVESGWNVAFRQKAVIVGWSRESDILFDKVLRDPGHAYQVIGCTPSAQGKFWVRPPSQVQILGDYSALPEIIRDHRPDIAIMADLDPVMGEIIALADLCLRENVQFKVIPSYFQTLSSGLHLEHVSGVPVLGVSKLPLDHVFNRIMKRAIDVAGAIVGLIISAPVIAMFGILIRRESPGPIFYTQPRSGHGGKIFKIYKLRSMKLDADANGLVRTVQNDPRCLKIGAFMRKWNIDEVPQFWNVLVGDMSLVGPRPERSEDVATLKDEITHYNARHFARPGLTGYAQVNGFRGNTDLTARLKYDLYYLENWSVFLDCYIVVRTLLKQKNAC
jgi:exopolysaccharide biosynthesis polyprenyl glycosylphosphotransferase